MKALEKLKEKLSSDIFTRLAEGDIVKISITNDERMALLIALEIGEAGMAHHAMLQKIAEGEADIRSHQDTTAEIYSKSEMFAYLLDEMEK